MYQSANLRLYNLSYSKVKTYLMAALFTAGNLILPQIVHLLPQGGPVWLPIYFFTLVGAFKYGLSAGLMTAVASPLINSALFGMPAAPMLAPIIIKSVLLASIASAAAYHFKRATLAILILVVLSYQALGTLFEWVLLSDSNLAFQDFRIGIPGMLVQVLGGWAVLNYILRK